MMGVWGGIRSVIQILQGHCYHLQIEDKDSRSYFLAPGHLLSSIYIPGLSFLGIYSGILIPSQPAGPHPCQDLPQAPNPHISHQMKVATREGAPGLAQV